jgi:hypothetical protein
MPPPTLRRVGSASDQIGARMTLGKSRFDWLQRGLGETPVEPLAVVAGERRELLERALLRGSSRLLDLG